MQQVSVSLNFVVTIALWGVTVLLTVAAWVALFLGSSDYAILLAVGGLLASVIGGVNQVRGYFERLSALVRLNSGIPAPGNTAEGDGLRICKRPE